MPRRRSAFKYTGEFYRRLVKENQRLKLIVSSQSGQSTTANVPAPDEIGHVPDDYSRNSAMETEDLEPFPSTSDHINIEYHTNSNLSDELTDDDDNTCDDDTDDEEILETAVSELRSWMIENMITHNAASKLLKWLRKNSFVGQRLPADSRTFLSTPRTVDIKEMGRGKFMYRGIQYCLQKLFFDQVEPLTIQLVVNIDGLPLSNSSKNEFWPILCAIDKMPEKGVMIVAIYMGDSKPDINLFLDEFITEQSNLLLCGVKVNDTVTINMIPPYFICDSPARCHLKGRKPFIAHH